MNNEQQQLILFQSLEQKLKSLTPLFYILLNVIFLGTYLIASHYYIPNVPPFQYIIYTAIVSLAINFVFQYQCKQRFINMTEIHVVAICLALVTCIFLYACKFNHFSLIFLLINQAWVLEMWYEIYILGERYTKSEVMPLFGITIGNVLSVWEYQFSFFAIILGLLGIVLLSFGVHHLKRICLTNPIQIYNTYLLYLIGFCGLIYPIQSFGQINSKLVIFSLFFGVLANIFLILLIRAFQIGQPAVMIALLFLIGIVGGILSLNIHFSIIKIVGVLLSLSFMTVLFLDHKTYIEVGGINVEPEENPYFELQKFQQQK